MRKEYNLSNMTWLEAIKDFMSNLSTYTQEVDIKEFAHDPFFKYNLKYKYMTYKSNVNGVYLHFIDWGNDYYSMLVSTEYEAGQEIFYQKGIIVNGELKTENFYEDRSYKSKLKVYTHHLPCISMYKPSKLVANYSIINNTAMLSGIYEAGAEYEMFTDTFTRTYNIIFGEVKRNRQFKSSFMMGGDFIPHLEVTHITEDFEQAKEASYRRSLIKLIPTTVIEDKTLRFHQMMYAGGIENVWVDNPEEDEEAWLWGTAPYKVETLHTLHFFIQTNIDEWQLRDTRYMLGGREEKVVLNGDKVKAESQLPNFKIEPIWATTLRIMPYIEMWTTTDLEDVGIPTYRYLMSREYLDTGRAVNTLNSTALIMPIYFYVRRDPQDVVTYSLYGMQDIVNYVNMYNMATNEMIDGTYPEKKDTFNCFQIGRRRQFYGTKGYNGLAFRQE